jgi:hypothetical protein
MTGICVSPDQKLLMVPAEKFPAAKPAEQEQKSVLGCLW